MIPGKPPKTSVYRPPAGTPFGDAYFKTEQDVHDNATDEELDWLEEHPLMWIRALSRMETVIQARMGIDKIGLKKKGPMPGQHPSREYLEARKAFEHKQQYRIHLLTVIGQRREEAKSMISDDSVITLMTVGDLAELMNQILDYAKEDDYEAIESSVLGVLKKIEERTGISE